MSEKPHVDGGVISVMADDDLRIHCVFCSRIVRQDQMVMLLRADPKGAWTAVCAQDAIQIFTDAMEGDGFTVVFKWIDS